VTPSDETETADAAADTDGARSRIPTFDRLFREILLTIADGAVWRLADVANAVGDLIELDHESRELLLPSGHRVFENRIRWATTSLVKAGLIERPRPSSVAITDAGRQVLDIADGPIDREFLRANCPGFAAWRADMGEDLPEERQPSGTPTVWMVRAGRNGAYAEFFVGRSAAILGWGDTGAIGDLSREELGRVVAECFPDDTRLQRGQAVNTLDRFAHTIANGDLVVTPEPATRTILLGWVEGPYEFLQEPVAGDAQHARGVSWFARVSRDEVSYGARNTLGSALTLTRPSNAEAELLRLAEAHADDPPPTPIALRSGRRVAGAGLVQRVSIPTNASVSRQATVSEFQTFTRRMVQLLDELHNGQLALPDFQRSFVWAPDATRELLVSIIRSFPAGALLFLQGGSSTFKARAAEEAPPLEAQPSHLVLDGQQRLTSLYQAIFGVGGPASFSISEP